MSTDVTRVEASPNPEDIAIIEKLMMEGDVSKLTDEQRLRYYYRFCGRLGLDPESNPLQYIVLQKKLVLYITARACDQIADKRFISRRIVDKAVIGDMYVVTAEAYDRSGRVEQSTGAVTIAGQVGEYKANAMLKAETRAKRRATISFTGLGVMGEDDADSIPDAQRVPLDRAHGGSTSTQVIDQQTGEITAAPANGHTVMLSERGYERLHALHNELAQYIDTCNLRGCAELVLPPAGLTQAQGKERAGAIKELLDACKEFVTKQAAPAAITEGTPLDDIGMPIL